MDFSKALGCNPKFPLEYRQLLTEMRQKVCDTLASQPASQPALDAIEEYLPHLMNLVDAAEKDKLAEIPFSWKCVLMVGTISGLKNQVSEKKTYHCPSIYFEGISLLLAYALGLANMAGKRVGSSALLAGEAALNEATDMYCRAAGIVSLLSQTWATRWTGSSAKSRPPETTPAGLAAIGEFMLLEAQILAAAKAEQRGMSVVTLVKLQRGAIEKFHTVKTAVKAAKASSGDWSDSFRLYVEEGALVSEAVMLKRFAAHAHSESKNGMAVACMTKSYNIFHVSLRSVKTECWARIYAGAKDDMKQTLDMYVRTNNHVTYDRIPTEEDMAMGLPTAASLVERKAYSLPMAAEMPEPTEEELAAAAPAPSKKAGSPASLEGSADKASTPSKPDEEEDEEAPRPSVKSAFKSLFKVEKKDVE